MDVHFKPETESRLNKLASKSGRATDDLVEDAMAGYLEEVAEVRQMLDSRYDDIKSGQVKSVDGEERGSRSRLGEFRFFRVQDLRVAGGYEASVPDRDI